MSLRLCLRTFAGLADLAGWLSWLERPRAHDKAEGSISSPGACWGSGSTDLPPPPHPLVPAHSFLPFLSLKPRVTSLGED